ECNPDRRQREHSTHASPHHSPLLLVVANRSGYRGRPTRPATLAGPDETRLRDEEGRSAVEPRVTQRAGALEQRAALEPGNAQKWATRSDERLPSTEHPFRHTDEQPRDRISAHDERNLNHQAREKAPVQGHGPRLAMSESGLDVLLHDEHTQGEQGK